MVWAASGMAWVHRATQARRFTRRLPNTIQPTRQQPTSMPEMPIESITRGGCEHIATGAAEVSRVQCSRVQHSAAQCSAAQCSTVQCSTMQHSTVQHRQHSTMQHNAVHTMQ